MALNCSFISSRRRRIASLVLLRDDCTMSFPAMPSLSCRGRSLNRSHVTRSGPGALTGDSSRLDSPSTTEIAMLHIVVLRTAYEHSPLTRLIETIHYAKVAHHFFIKLTTLNDEIIDKDLLLNLNLYQVTYGLDFLIVLTVVCRREGGQGPYDTMWILIRVRPPLLA